MGIGLVRVMLASPMGEERVAKGATIAFKEISPRFIKRVRLPKQAKLKCVLRTRT